MPIYTEEDLDAEKNKFGEFGLVESDYVFIS